MLPGMVMPHGGRLGFIKEVARVTAPTGGATSFTFSGVSFGPAFPGRVLIAAIALNRAADGALDQIACTIGGVSASGGDDGTSQSFLTNGCGLWGAAVPTGTSGDVFVDWTGLGSDQQGLILLAAQGLALPQFDDVDQAGSGNGTSVNTTVDVPAAGALIAASSHRNANATTFTGVTKRAEYEYDSGVASMAVGWDLRLPSEIGRSVQASWTGSVTRALRVQTFSRG